jgi:hypothetical protein
MICEVCSQYERQLRGLEMELNEAEALPRDVSVHPAEVLLRSHRVTDLRLQVDAAKVVLGIHRRREACAGETDFLGAELGRQPGLIDARPT